MAYGSRYQIPDEPRPGPLQRLIVDPLFPLLGVMLVGPWFGLTWLAINSALLNSPSKVREIAACVASAAAAVLLVSLLLIPEFAGLFARSQVKYYLLLITVVHLSFSYWVFLRQQNGFSIFEHFGGKSGPGLVILLVGMFLLDDFVTNKIMELGLLGVSLR